ncbi:MAG: 4Fe-4S binding protein, partial [Candidatus Ornithomonoglobus sp.]
RDKFGLGTTYFCKYLCPAGTLEAGLPLLAANESLRFSIGNMFYIKLSILIACLVLSIVIYRPFCKYLCPLGAFYAVFNKYSIFRFEVDKSKCTGCGKCERVCAMNVEVTKNINSPECIRCGKCAAVCPSEAIQHCGIKRKKK